MKKLLILFYLFPVYCLAQKIPDYGFNKIKIVTDDKLIEAEISPVETLPRAKPDLIYFWYRSNTISSSQGGYSGKLLNGTYNEFYTNKGLKEQGIFNKGLKDGIWKDWYADGILQQLCTWNRGRKSGKFIMYDTQGLVKQRGNYKNGILCSDSLSFWKKINILKKIGL